MASFAAIDVGSNALRLRIAEAEKPREGDGSPVADWKEIASQRIPVRLGHDVFLNAMLAPAAISSACEALRSFRDAMDAAKVDRYRAVATSAVREAKNGFLLVERAEREAGVVLEVIEGIEEARLIRRAVERRFGKLDRPALLFDIGGGSTELSLVDRGHIEFSRSLAIGTVRLLEAFLERDRPLGRRQTTLIKEYVDRVLGEAMPELQVVSTAQLLIGTGGNIETLAQLCPASDPFGAAIDVERLRSMLPKLAALAPSARAVEYGLKPDRADVIVPAAHIVLRIAELCHASSVVAPDVGLKEGILEDLYAQHFARWDWSGEVEAVMEACLRLGRRYHFDEAHGQLVAHLATRLFDQLKQRHGLGRRERLILQAAALLHDVGDFVRYEGHHKHSYYIIEHSDLMGLTPMERTLVANVARYHRKSPPDVSHANFRDLDRDGKRTVRALAAILRVADALDREHLGKVQDLRLSLVNGSARIRLDSPPDVELEEWTVEHKASMFRDVFDLEVDLVVKG